LHLKLKQDQITKGLYQWQDERRGSGQSHKGKDLRRAIRAAGAFLLFLHKYSPDLNPIEQFFARLKHRLREAAKRSIEAVSAAIGAILNTVTATECAHYFANSGYEQT
jgi:transposase